MGCSENYVTLPKYWWPALKILSFPTFSHRIKVSCCCKLWKSTSGNVNAICSKWGKTAKNTDILQVFLYRYFFKVSVRLYLRWSHSFLTTAPMSGVLFALQLTEAQKISPGLCSSSAGFERMVSVAVNLNTDDPVGSPRLWDQSLQLQHCWTSSDRTCNQPPSMRCVWDELLDSSLVIHNQLWGHARVRQHTWSLDFRPWLQTNWERTC